MIDFIVIRQYGDYSHIGFCSWNRRSNGAEEQDWSSCYVENYYQISIVSNFLSDCLNMNFRSGRNGLECQFFYASGQNATKWLKIKSETIGGVNLIVHTDIIAAADGDDSYIGGSENSPKVYIAGDRTILEKILCIYGDLVDEDMTMSRDVFMETITAACLAAQI